MDQYQQIAFVKGISKILFKFEDNVLKKRVIPAVMNLGKFDYLIPAIVQIVMDVMKREGFLSKSE